MAAPNISELRQMTDEQLIATHDGLAPDVLVGLQYYIDELSRRNQSKQTEAMLRYTRWIAGMTFIVTLATIVNVGIACLLYQHR